MQTMGEREKQTLIGAFVLGALVLLVAGVALFGSGRYFTSYKKAVLFFSGSVKGLNVGSAVMFEGVKIGSVSDIRLIADLDDMTLEIPVIIEIDPGKIARVGSDTHADYLEALIAKGLRAQLQMQSMVTGQLVINLGFYPDTPAPKPREDEIEEQYTFDYPEIPTVPSTSQALQQMLEGLPVRDMIERTQSVLIGLDRMVNSPELSSTLIDLQRTLAEMRRVLQTLNRDLPPLAGDARQTLASANAAIGHADRWLADNRDVGQEVATDLATTLTELRTLFATTRQTLETVKDKVADERISYQLQGALREVAEAARSLRLLSDYLERHPEALLRGRPQGG